MYRSDENFEGVPDVKFYDELIAGQTADYTWPELSDELSASSLCYTSGTHR